MAKSKKQSVGKSILLFILFLLILVLLVGVFSYFLQADGEDTENDFLSVTIDGEAYEEDIKGQILTSGQIVTVSCLESKGYDITIKTIPVADFTFYMDGELDNWNSTGNANFTSAFGIEKNGNEFSLNYIEYATIVAKFLGIDNHESIVFDTKPAADVFTLNVTSGSKTINIDFDITVNVSDINLDENIIF